MHDHLRSLTIVSRYLQVPFHISLSSCSVIVSHLHLSHHSIATHASVFISLLPDLTKNRLRLMRRRYLPPSASTQTEVPIRVDVITPQEETAITVVISHMLLVDQAPSDMSCDRADLAGPQCLTGGFPSTIPSLKYARRKKKSYCCRNSPRSE